uniref:EF-hand domain-containing protein n=3 Tax=Sus scrofa TaxID=9823 RepID=A0A8D0Q9E6_PIG
MRKRIPGNWVGAGPCHSYGPEGGESRCEWHLGAEVTHPTSGWAGPGRQEHESWAERGTGGGWRGAASCQRPGGEAGPPPGQLGAARGGAGGGEAGAQGGGAVCRMAYPGHPGAGGGGYYPGGYGGAPGGPAFPAQTQDPLYGYFAAVAGQDGQIDADELQRCLTQSGIAGGYKPFNLETCRLMVSMLDRDMSGTMGFNEFKELWAVLNGWRQHFISFDSDRSGTVDPQELQKALTTMGFRLSPQAVNSIAKRYSTNGKITFDDYIACCVKLRALTDSFRRRDTAQQGVVNFPYDDFIQCVMSV